MSMLDLGVEQTLNNCQGVQISQVEACSKSRHEQGPWWKRL
jgi:hypothetical protein